MKTVPISAALAAAVMAATPVQARDVSISATVDYTGLDLSTTEGVAILERRVDKAIRQLCATYDRRDAVGSRPIAECKRSITLEPSLETLIARAKSESSANKTVAVAKE